jgi:hypothetical protein
MSFAVKELIGKLIKEVPMARYLRSIVLRNLTENILASPPPPSSPSVEEVAKKQGDTPPARVLNLLQD